MYLRIDFPSGRYYAAQAHAPSLPEWPPHPSRIFSALVASAYRSCAGITAQKRAALKWFETLSAPYIVAPNATLLESPVFYVPPGDLMIYEHGVHRWRQPRYYPCAVILDEPTVYYGWDSDPESSNFAALEKIAANVTHVGTSHSMVIMSAHCGMMPKKPTMLPDKVGTKFVRIPASGRLDELDTVYENQTGVRRPAATCEPLAAYKEAYVSSDSKKESQFDFIALRIANTMHGADTAAYLGKALRRSVMSVLGNRAPAAVHGHNGGAHVGWLPLPDVGHRYAKGRIVGIGVALPRKMDLTHYQQVLSGISRISDLHLPDGRTAKLFPIKLSEKTPVALKNQTWIRPSTVWSTVTPVVLDRPPKRLTEKRLARALEQSLGFAGYPKPDTIEVSAFSRFKGAPPAFRISADKPRYHATIRFNEPVTGPVIAGRLRYFGVGLFRPLRSADNGSMV
jgi:CRISPR-associated protein Csb2